MKFLQKSKQMRKIEISRNVKKIDFEKVLILEGYVCLKNVKSNYQNLSSMCFQRI